MDDLTPLIDLLAMYVDAAVIAKALGFGAAVLLLVRLTLRIQWFDERRKWTGPALALAFGQLAGWLATSDPLSATLAGAVVGLTAVGVYSASKNVNEALKGE